MVIYIYIYIYIDMDIGLGVRVFANGPGDLGSIPGRVIPKTQKMVLDASLLSTQHYKVRIKGKVEQSRKEVAPSPTHWCSSYRKGSLRVTLDYGRQLFIYIYIWKLIRFLLYFRDRQIRYLADGVFLCYSIFRRVKLLLERVLREISFLILRSSVRTSFSF